MVDFDYVIVGAGAAGSVLANRLSEDPANQVLLPEYGGRDANPMIYVPLGFYFTLRGERYTYHYPTRPVGPSGQAEAWTRGKVLGGVDRGQRNDVDPGRGDRLGQAGGPRQCRIRLGTGAGCLPGDGRP
jgi:hypothetical protein